jgi:hypothetical protein
MGQVQYCVYDQTSECFLSLGVTYRESALAHWKGILGRGREQRYDEGNWLVRPKGIHLFRFFSSRDLVFLDEKHRVIQAIESFPPLRLAPVDPNATSVLALPVRTISASQTQPGNQLVICVAEEMEFRLRHVPDLDKNHSIDEPLDGELPALDAQPVVEERRMTRRRRCPRLVAYDSTGGALEVHGMKDLGANGLYLMTKERWPLGTLVTMTLQRTDRLDDHSTKNAIVAQLRVARWGEDGVGLAFAPSEVEEPRFMALTAR